MSLDLVVLGSDGRPERTVSLDVNQHALLMDYASRLGAGGVMRRMEDYYEDTVFEHGELDLLEREAEAIDSSPEADPEIQSKMREVVALIGFARRKNKEIEALAD